MIVKETNACFAQRLVEDKIIDAYLIVANKYLNKSYLFDFKLIYILTRQTYYAVIHPTFSRLEIGDSIMRMTRSKNKIGFLGDPSTMEQNTKRRNDICIYSRLIEVPKNMTREIDRNWHFIKMLGAKTTVESVPKIVCRNLDDKKAFSLLKKHSIDQKTFCVIFPGASERLRMWPEEKFAKLASIIVSKGITPIICGKSLEMEIAKRIKAVESNSIIMCNETDIWTLASILKQSIFYVGNDTGIAHLSAAVGTPTICIIGGGHFERFFPYGDRNINRIVYNHNITCKYDNWKCSPTTNRPAPCLSSVEVSCVEREISNLLETLHINK
jgi:ADP-heptose:LPS heptosyltransferase